MDKNADADETYGRHFAGTVLMNGARAAAPGETETYDGRLMLGVSGPHFSERVLDALYYAPATAVWLRRVRADGEILRDKDKAAGHRRHVLWQVDCRELLRFAALQFFLDATTLRNELEVVPWQLNTNSLCFSGATWNASNVAASVAASIAASAAAEADQERRIVQWACALRTGPLMQS